MPPLPLPPWPPPPQEGSACRGGGGGPARPGGGPACPGGDPSHPGGGPARPGGCPAHAGGCPVSACPESPTGRSLQFQSASMEVDRRGQLVKRNGGGHFPQTGHSGDPEGRNPTAADHHPGKDRLLLHVGVYIVFCCFLFYGGRDLWVGL